MGKTVKRRPLSRRSLFFINFVLLLIPLTFFGYEPILRSVGRFLIVSEQPETADAIVVLGGGDPARAYQAVQLYRDHKAPQIVITTGNPPRIYEQMKRDGVHLFLSYENYLRVISGYGVPDDKILRVENYAGDTLEEMKQIRQFADQRRWKKLIVVTSNFHTRRAKLVARYVMEPDIKVQVVESQSDSFDPDAWWKTQEDIRTLAVEFEKFLSYSLYIWPRLVVRVM